MSEENKDYTWEFGSSIPVRFINAIEINWIKCSERMPEIDQKVVFYNKDRDFCYCGYFCEDKGFRENLDDWWFEDEEITHWMPIEHPPKD